jgi:hypothetical protein
MAARMTPSAIVQKRAMDLANRYIPYLERPEYVSLETR